MVLQNLGYGKGLLVIVGAGASFDSIKPEMGAVGGDPPPLTKDIAGPSARSDQLALRYPNVQPLLDELRTRLASAGDEPSQEADALEAILKEYLDRSAVEINARRHVAAMRYYLRDLLDDATRSVLTANGGITNYTGLVRRCYRWASENHTYVCFVSFNYDYLLESACQNNFFFNPATLADYSENPLVSVLKPHGSILWATAHPDLEVVENPKQGPIDAIQSGEPFQDLDGAIIAEASPPELVGAVYGNGTYYGTVAYPALALPMAGKSHLVWPKDQDELLRTKIHNGSFGRLLCVGWRAAEQHFTPLLSRLIPDTSKILVVSKDASDGQETISNLAAHIAVRTYPSISENGFSGIDPHEWAWLLD